jgi:transposase
MSRHDNSKRDLPPEGGLFPPEHSQIVQETIQQSPQPDTKRSRWTLALLREHCLPLSRYTTLSGVWRRLKRLRLRWRRGRLHVSSPDPEYKSKLAVIAQAISEALLSPKTHCVLYSDETTCYRHPPVGTCWQGSGGDGAGQKKATRGQGSNTTCRIVGSLDVHSGRVLSRLGSKAGVDALCAFLKQVRQQYGAEIRLTLVWDNWPVHFHPKVVATALEQRITLLRLPTYAPWTNPIEKVWRKLKEELLSMHECTNRWEELKQAMREFLAAYDREAPDLLHYVGLSNTN